MPDFSQSFNERPGQARPFCRHVGQEDVYITVIVSDVLLLTPCKYDMTIWQAHTKGVPDFSQSSFNERLGQARPFCRHFDQFSTSTRVYGRPRSTGNLLKTSSVHMYFVLCSV